MSLEGTVLGHYRLTQLVGSGGMGEVYLAEDIRIARRIAVKVVRSELDPYPNAPVAQESARLFQREMKAIAMLDHPNILPLIDFGELTMQRGMYTYLVMPYRPEGSLVDWLQAHGDMLLPPEDIARLVLQAADALQYAHEQQIVHLDVKASNFLVRTRQGRGALPDILLTDFGIARFSNATATASQSIRGTPSAMAPEQWAGRPTPASDQYALAVMTYQLLTGIVPFQGTMQQILYKHMYELPLPPGRHNPRISPSVDAVLLRALAKKPEERFPSVQTFATALQSAANDSLTTMSNTPSSYAQNDAEEAIPTIAMTPAVPLQVEENIPTVLLSQTPPPPPPFVPVQPVIQATIPEQSPSARNKFSLKLMLALVIMLVLGSALTFAFVHFQAHSTTTGTSNSTPSIGKQASTATTAPTSQQAPTALSTSQVTSVGAIHYGKLLYTTSAPSSQCDKGGGKWADYNYPKLQCAATGTTMSNTNSASPNLAGTILMILPNGTYANDYVIEAQIQQANTSSDFGIYFRNQPGSQPGIYSFFIHPDGSWGTYVYDNTSGAQSQIASGAASIDAHSLLRLTVVVIGANFTFYVNGQNVGKAYDKTYSAGEAGIVVDAGGVIVVKSFSLYAVA
jgi:serine/threonine protein kinase